MLPIIDDFVCRFNLTEFVVVADSGLMNAKNVSLLESAGYKYIIGARIKNESDAIKRWILSQPKQDGKFYEMSKTKTCRLIINYSDKRAKKDAYNRDKGVKRLKRDYGSGKISKENINKRGYNKFLEIKDDITVCIDENKINDDVQWDGLKGYITNTALDAKTVCEQYRGLWVVERAYRVTKGTIELRPMFHFTPRRIEAHVCVCFVAYKLYKELERLLKTNHINISADKALDIAKTITTINIQLPKNGEMITKTMFLTPLHKLIEPLFRDEFYEK
jgi:transposase